jgi:uncharacterized membrane protein
MTYLVHILAGSLALMSGYVALYSAKGAPLHRKAGIVFVYAMLMMSLFGVTIAATRGIAMAINIPAGVLTAYLVVTALTAVRPPAAGARWLDRGAILVALALGLTCVVLAVDALANAKGAAKGMAYPLFMFGGVALLAAKGDLHVIRCGETPGQ